MNAFRLHPETQIALIYLVFGGLWILFSDRLLVRFAATPEALTQIQTYKGWFFVAASAVLIFFLLRHSLEKERRAQAALKENQERILQGERQYRLLFENNPLPMWIYDQESLRFLAVNQAARWKYGYSNSEFLSMTIKDIRPGYEILAMLEKTKNHHDQVQVSGPWVHEKKNGERMYIEIVSCSLEYFGSPARLVMANDVTERKQAEDALRESEERYRRLTENAPDLIYRYEFVPERRFAYVNPAATAITGYTPEEHYADPDLGFKLVHPEDRPLLEQVILGESLAPLILRWRKKDGTTIWTEQRNVPIYDSNGRLIAIEGVARNITERKQAEQALRQISVRLAEAQEAERLALSKELHDQVGQSLTALGINLNLVRGAIERGSPESLTLRFDSSFELLEEITEKIRDIMAELHPPVLEDYGLAAALRWLAERLKRQTGLDVEVHGKLIEPRLPLVTAISLFRIAREALNNVVKHAGVMRASVTLEEGKEGVLLHIEDNGKGFQPRSVVQDGQVHWGLATMRERAEMLKGHLHIDSAPGQGTRVSISVPREAA